MGGIESLIGITDVTQVVTLFLFGTKYKFVLWQLSVMVGIGSTIITAILSHAVPGTFSIKSSIRSVIGAPIVEEVLYRLILLTTIFYFTESTALAILLSAVVFGLVHLATGGARFPHTFIGGIVLGIMFVNFGLLSVIIVHMTHNFIATVLH